MAMCAAFGAMNVDGFRERLVRGQLPKRESFQLQGLFNQYFFDTGMSSPPTELVQPSYSLARSKNPTTDEIETFLALGLNSVEDGKNRRAPLNIIVVLDISGSMGAYFDSVYMEMSNRDLRDGASYDANIVMQLVMMGFGENRARRAAVAVSNSSAQAALNWVFEHEQDPDIDDPLPGDLAGGANPALPSVKTKMQIAVDVMKSIVGVVQPDERFGLVLFDEKVDILQPIRAMKHVDVEDLMQRVSGITERGGTNMELGLSTALEMMRDLIQSDDPASSDPVPENNRIIFLTDAQPTRGGGKDSLLNLLQGAVADRIYCSFIGVGLDFDDAMVNEITKVRGANYFSVHSAKQFNKILVEDFNYMVTPIAFDTQLFLESDSWEIDRVYNSPLADEATGCLMKVETIAASALDDVKGVKGGIVLIRVKRREGVVEEGVDQLDLMLQYELPNGIVEKIVQRVDLGERIPVEGEIPCFENAGIHKAVLLAQFGVLVEETIDAVQTRIEETGTERNAVSDEVKRNLKQFKRFFQREAKTLQDLDLVKELDVLDRFIFYRN